MQQLPNVKDETCKNQDCAALVSKRHRETGNKRVREEERKAERRGRDRQKRQEMEEKSPNRLCFNYQRRKGGEKLRFLLVRLSLWIKRYIYISD